MILNGPRRFGVSFAFWWGSFKWDTSSQACSWRWNCDGGGPFWLATLLSARMASARFLVIVCIRDSTRALWVCSTLSELSVGLYPKRILLGESPLVWGWNAVDRFRLIPSFSERALPNCEVNLGSRSLIILVGRPNHR